MALDIITLCVVIIGFYMGFSKGIVRTIFTVLSFALGIVAAFKLATPMTNFLADLTGSTSPLLFIAGALLSFVAIWLFLRLIARTIEGFLETANLNFINQILGGILMVVLLTHLYSFLLVFFVRSGVVTDEIQRESRTYAYVEKFPETAKVIYAYVEPVVRDFWDETVAFMDRVEDMDVGERDDSDPNIFDIEDSDEDAAEFQ